MTKEEFKILVYLTQKLEREGVSKNLSLEKILELCHQNIETPPLSLSQTSSGLSNSNNTLVKSNNMEEKTLEISDPDLGKHEVTQPPLTYEAGKFFMRSNATSFYFPISFTRPRKAVALKKKKTRK